MKCTECGLENYHRMDCGSKILMMDYEAFVSKIEQLPDELIDNLIRMCNKEIYYRRDNEESKVQSLFDMYVRKEG